MSETLDHVVAIVEATCDGRMSAAKVVDFHGKIVVCLDEMFYGGTLSTTDVETVLRNAKLKG